MLWKSLALSAAAVERLAAECSSAPISHHSFTGVTSGNAESVVLAVTGRSSLRDALQWIAEGRRLRKVESHVLLAALSDLLNGPLSDEASAAIARFVRLVAQSGVDSSTNLLETETVTATHVYQQALQTLATFTPTRTLASTSAEAVGAAQAENPDVMLTLCQVAGLTYRDLVEQAGRRGTRLPSAPRGRWSHEQIVAAYEIVDGIVEGTAQATLPGAVAARPVELLMGKATGWEAVDRLWQHGLPYEALLMQRAVGSAWGAHRNHTANKLTRIVLDTLCGELEELGVGFWRSRLVGGSMSPRDLARAVGRGDTAGQVGVVTLTRLGHPGLAIAVAHARDGGTARKTGGKLSQLPGLLRVPSAVLLLGPGWALRRETAQLVRPFDGLLFTEATIDDLVALAERLA